jgi:Outer membrane protein beta-barrel family/CarboxypepD_reg-like domain
MKIFPLFLAAFLGLAPNLFAQKPVSKAEISGTVLDSITNKPLRMASVSLLTERDSSYVDGTITDGDGRFRFRNTASGRYRLLVTFVGYRSASQYVTVGREPRVDVGTVLMNEQTNTLNEVVIREERAPVTMKQDTIEFNANSFKTQPNAAVEDMLRKLPGVEVSRDGTIRAQGQTVNKVLVDGKPFFGNDPKMATRNLPADIIDKVQLYDQSSDQSQFSGIDDGNRERTINLTIKRDKRKGYFGQNAVGAGTDGRYQGRLNVNRFNSGRQLSLIGQANNLNQQNFTLPDGAQPGGGINGPTFVGAGMGIQAASQMPTNIVETRAGGINYRDRLSKRAEIATSYFLNQAITTTEGQSQRQTVLPDRSFLTNQTNYLQNRQLTNRFAARLDWQIDSLTSLRLTPNIAWQNTRYNSSLVSRSFQTGGQPLNAGETSYGTTGNGLNGYNNLLLMRKFRREGRSFSANLNTTMINGRTQALNQSSNTLYDSGITNPAIFRLDQQNNQRAYALQNTLTLSFTEPLSLTQKVEFRYAYSANSNRPEREVTDWNDATGQYDRQNTQLSNRFSSLFATHRLGTTIQNRRLRYTYALGFDVQQSQLQLQNRSADTASGSSYLHLMPNALFSYTFSGNRSIRLQYRTRLSAPSVMQLQPVVDNSNPLNVQQGNPALQPEYYNILTLTYNGARSLGSRNLFLLANLNQSNTRIGTATTIDQTGVQTTQPVNAGGYWSGTGFLSISRKISPSRLTLTLTTNAALTRAISFVNRQENESHNVSVGQGIRLQTNYNDKFDVGLSGTLNYQMATYSLLPRQNTAFWAQYATADIYWKLPLGFALFSDVTYTATSGRSAGYNQQFVLWNLALSRTFLKGNQGELRLHVFDLLNQNRSVTRNTADSYVEDVQNRVLQRYGIISFIYNLRKFGV